MYHIGTWDWDFTGDVRGDAAKASGYSRASLVDRRSGAVHSDVGTCRLESGGELPLHVHSHEECAYVLEGYPMVDIGGRRHRLRPGDYVFFPLGMPHGWTNPDASEARWLDLNTPQVELNDAGLAGSAFFPRGHRRAALPVSDAAWDLGDPSLHHLGHYDGTPPQLDALTVVGAPRGRAAAGMDTALLAYSGISVKLMVDQNLGADLLTMFMVDYEPGGAAQVHDHPFEEVYIFLSGEIEAVVEDVQHTFRAGDFLFCGVGSSHGFFNESSGRVRWIETQAPQPPRRHAYRWMAHWNLLKERLEGGK